VPTYLRFHVLPVQPLEHSLPLEHAQPLDRSLFETGKHAVLEMHTASETYAALKTQAAFKKRLISGHMQPLNNLLFFFRLLIR